MSIDLISVINKCRESGIELTLNGDKISITAQKGRVDKDILGQIKANKSGLIAVLKKQQQLQQNEIKYTDKITSSDFPLAQLSLKKTKEIAEKYPSIRKLYPATPMQVGMLYQGVVDGSGESYTNVMSCDLVGEVDQQVLTQAWQTVVNRHDIFRTLFVGFETEQIHQLVLSEVELKLKLHDIQALSPQAQKQHLDSFKSQDKNQGFDFSQAPLMRVHLFKLQGQRYHMVWTVHHTLVDGWSVPIAFNEVVALYHNSLGGQTIALPQPESFERYVAWLSEQDEQQANGFWQAQLSDVTPTDLPRVLQQQNQTAESSSQDNSQRETSLRITRETAQQLNRLAGRCDSTLFCLLQYVWGYLLCQYNGQSQCVFGITSSGRPADLKGADKMLGLFINTVPMVFKLDSEQSVAEFLSRQNLKNIEANQFSYLALPQIQKLADMPSGENLFDSLIVFNNFPAQNQSDSDSSTLAFSNPEFHDHTNYGIGIEAYITDDLYINFGFCERRFCPDKITELSEHFATLLHRFAKASPEDSLKMLSLLPDANRAHATEAKTQTVEGKTLGQMFSNQVANKPNAMALACGQVSLTFAELDLKVNQLAARLTAQGVERASRIAVCLPRSPEQVIAILAISKCGGCYVPIDASAPVARQNHILKDAGVSHLVTQSSYVKAMDTHGIELVCFDEGKVIPQKEFTPAAFDASALAYIIYTSGSSGSAKGVMTDQHNLANFMVGFAEQLTQLDVDTDIIWLWNAAYVFDASLKGLFILCSGGQLVIPTENEVKNTHRLVELIDTYKVPVFNATPALMAPMLEAVNESGKFKPHLLASGDDVPLALWQSMFHYCQRNERKAINAYGPTELTVNACFALIDNENDINIGKPMLNTQAYVLGPDLALLPDGIPGELCVGGPGVAQGYLNRPELSTQVFIQNPFSADPGNKLYRTGDSVVRRADGSLQFLGRIDTQVKVRGYRIEPGEIESRLSKHDEVQSCVVVTRTHDDGNKQLVAYFSSQTQDLKGLEQYLADWLPDYMIPAFVIQLDEWPLLPSGKVDKQALPDPSQIKTSAVVEQAELSEMEQAFVDIWKQVLKLEEVSIDDNFFALGGDSILSIQMVSRALKQGIKFTAKDFYSAPTIRHVAERAQFKNAATTKPTASAQNKTALPVSKPVVSQFELLPIQKRFFELHEEDLNHHNQSLLLNLAGSVDLTKLQNAIESVLKSHDAFSQRFVKNAQGRYCGELFQQTDDYFDKVFNRIDLSKLQKSTLSGRALSGRALADKTLELKQSLNLQKGDLVRVGLFDATTEHSAKLFITIHHMVIDGVSWRVLMAAVEQAYQAIIDGKTPPSLLDTGSIEKTTQAVYQYAKGDELKAEVDYWRAIQQDINQRAKSVDNQWQQALVADNQWVDVRLSSQQTDALISQSGKAYNTQINDLLLSGLFAGLSSFFGEAAFYVDMEGHGRELIQNIGQNAESVGWFTSIYPVMLRGSKDDIGELICQTKETLNAIPSKGVGYGILRYLDKTHDIDFAGSPEILFNYLGQTDAALPEDSLFSYASDATGSDVSAKRKRSHKLVFNAMVMHGELVIRADFSPNSLQLAEVSALCAEIKAALIAVAEHCTSQTVTRHTPSDFPLARINQSQLNELQKERAISQLYPATPMQQGLIFANMLEQAAGSYVTQTWFTLQGEMNTQLFRQAWQMVVERHDVFRTAFVGFDFEIHQLVSPVAKLPWFEQDLSHLTESEQQQAFEQYRLDDCQQPLAFDNPPLMRVAVFKTEARQLKVLWTHHHCIVDGWCASVIFSDLMSAYFALAGANDWQIQPAGRYSDYIAWLQQQDKTQAREFWQSYLKGIESSTPLPVTDSSITHNGALAEHSVSLNEQQLTALAQLAKDNEVTLNSLIQGAWGYLLHRYSGSDNVVFGTVVSGRPAELANVETTVGLFIRTIPIKVDCQSKPLGAWLRELHNNQISADGYSYLGLSDIQKAAEFEGNLFDSLVIFSNYPLNDEAAKISKTTGISVHSIHVDESTEYSLNLAVDAVRELTMTFKYGADKFTPALIAQMAEQLQQILLSMLTLSLEGDITQLALYSPEQQHQLLNSLAGKEKPLPQVSGVHQLFEQAVEKQPEAIAVEDDETHLSYQTLENKVNQLAHYLLSLGVEREQLIGVGCDGHWQMLVSQLAIMKAGATFVPVDVEAPQERRAHIINQCKMDILLCRTEHADKFASKVSHTLAVDDAEVVARLSALPQSRPDIRLNDDGSSLAYVIFTSGSTGKPKGVEIEQRGLINLAGYLIDTLQYCNQSCLLQYYSGAFDAGVEDWLVTLASGARLRFVDGEAKHSIERLTEIIQKSDITHLHIPPSVLALLDPAQLIGVKVLEVGGEKYSDQLPQKWADNRVFFNVYGPTETTITSSLWRWQPGVPMQLGTALDNLRYYVLDKQKRICPPGAVGELYIGGPAVARGYLNQPELTQNSFVADPFIAGQTIYKTGDLVSYQDNGSVAFVGRVDAQVKLRGYRIELGEIENQLEQLPNVKQAVVILHEPKDGHKSIVAYVKPWQQESADNAQLLQQLATRLPKYMLPGHILFVSSFVLNVNGKIDRKRLPEPESMVPENTFEAPVNALEAQLCQIWLKVLGCRAVGRNDNFFTLGGDSILSIQLVSAARREGLLFSVKQLFNHPTVAQLATVVSKPQEDIGQNALEQGECLLSPIQQLFLTGPVTDKSHFNQSAMIELPAGVTKVQVEQMVSALFNRHDGLRLCFNEHVTGKWQAHYSLSAEDAVKHSLSYHCLTEQTADEQQHIVTQVADTLQKGLDICKGQLIKVAHFDGGAAQPGRLLIIIHHLVVDGVSWRILLDDLQSAWHNLADNKPIQLPAKTASFKRWTAFLNDYAQSQYLGKEKALWQSQLVDVDERSQEECWPEADYANVSLSLSKALTDKLLTQCSRAYNNQIQELLLAGLYLAMQRTCGNQSLTISLEGHGREALPGAPDISETLGWFTCVYPLRLSPQSSDLAEVICHAKDSLRNIPHKGIGYSVLTQLSKGENRLEAPSYPGEVLFNYLGQFEQGQDLNPVRFVNEYAGRNVADAVSRHHLLEINSRVFENALHLRFDYHQQRFGLHQAEQLKAAYEQALEAIVEHCLTAQPRLTKSDFPLAEIDNVQLAQWQGEYDIYDIYPATSAQTGLLFHSMMDSAQANYITQVWMTLSGDLDSELFKLAWQQVIDDIDIFRTAFVGMSGQAQQLVCKTAAVRWQQIDHQLLDSEQQNQAFESFLIEDKQVPFDFAAPPLMRLTLWRLSQDKFRVLWTHHHSLLDGWCQSLVFNRVIACYQALVKNTQVNLTKPVPYNRYIQWLSQQDEAPAVEFWQQTLGDVEEVTQLKQARYEPLHNTGVVDNCIELLSEAQTQRLVEFTQQQGVTLNSLVQGAWSLLLHYYCHVEAPVFGVTVSGRPAQLAGVEQMIGLFIKTIPFKGVIAPKQSVSQWLKGIQKQQVESDQYSYLALNEIKKFSRVNGELFNTLMVFENYLIAEALPEATQGLDIAVVDSGVNEQTHYDLTLKVAPGNQLKLKFEYSVDCFDSEYMTQLMRQLNALLLAISEDGEKPLKQIELLGKTEQIDWLAGHPVTEHRKSNINSMHQWFEAQVDKTPEQLAVSDEHNRLTYRQLDNDANRLANELIALGVKPQEPVAVYCRRSTELIIALWAIWKAGGCYLPLDKDLPESRLAFMAKDCGAKVLLHPFADTPTAAFDDCIKVNINEVVDQSTACDRPVVAQNAAEQLAYIIYTSGSTGTPKGVGVEHHALVNRIDWMAREYDLNTQDVVLHKTPMSFDVSMWELTLPFICGAAMVVAKPGGHKDPQYLSELITQQGITTIHFVPSMLTQMLASGFWSMCNSIRQVFCSGEALSASTVQLHYQLHDAQLHNLYGPTEAAIDVSYWHASAENARNIVPIGKAIDNVRLYVLSENLTLLPNGCIGQLYIAGRGLARGYIGNDELNKRQFINHQFADGRIERLYRTGDLARYLEDDNLEYLGRIDSQVKLHGNRIELAEIESQLLELENVQSAAVKLIEDDQRRYLCGYVSLIEAVDDELLETQLAQQLRSHLPEYMVPTRFVQMAQMPLTTSGKLDRKALPMPQVISVDSDNLVRPATKLQQRLSALWQNVLQLETVGITQNFFSLGGDSIVAIKLVSKAREAGLHFKVEQLFQYPTIEGLCQVVSETENQSLPQGPVSGEQNLLPIQQMLFQRKLNQPNHYNQSVLLKTSAELDVDKLKQVVAAILQRHDALRLRFSQTEGKWQGHYQSYRQQWLDEIVQIHQLQGDGEIDSTQITDACQHYQQSLNIEKGPLLRFVLFSHKGESVRLFIVAHHLIVDAVSWQILFNDLQNGYQQLVKGEPLKLMAKTVAYQHWGESLLELANSVQIQAELPYWQAQLAKPAISLQPVDIDNTSNEMGLPVTKNAVAEIETTQALIGSANDAYRTQPQELILSAVLLAFSDVFGGEVLRLSMESHGRDGALTGLDVSETMGWFTQVYPLVLDRQNCRQGDMAELIKSVKEQHRSVPNKGIGFGLLRYLAKAPGLQQGYQSEREIEFNYLGQLGAIIAPEGEFSLAGEDKGKDNGNPGQSKAMVVNAFIQNDRLSIAFNGDPAQVAADKVDALCDRFAEALEAVVGHCNEHNNDGALINALVSDIAVDAFDIEEEGIEL